MTIISPSILSLDFSQLNSQMDAVNASRAQWLHYDVMDGHFVPNLTFGPDILKAFRKLTDRQLDVHLMISDPRKYAPVFAQAGAQWITFHYEAMNDAQDCRALAKELRALGVKPGISIKPQTPVSVLEALWQDFDLVLVLSLIHIFTSIKALSTPSSTTRSNCVREAKKVWSTPFCASCCGADRNRCLSRNPSRIWR